MSLKEELKQQETLLVEHIQATINQQSLLKITIDNMEGLVHSYLTRYYFSDLHGELTISGDINKIDVTTYRNVKEVDYRDKVFVTIVYQMDYKNRKPYVELNTGNLNMNCTTKKGSYQTLIGILKEFSENGDFCQLLLDNFNNVNVEYDKQCLRQQDEAATRDKIRSLKVDILFEAFKELCIPSSVIVVSTNYNKPNYYVINKVTDRTLNITSATNNSGANINLKRITLKILYRNCNDKYNPWKIITKEDYVAETI
jgi:hypothetical protein